MAENSIQLRLQTDLDLLPTDVPSQRVLQIDVRAPDSPRRKERTKLNLALVIDRSGSMSGGKLEYVKEAVLHVLDLLQEQDRVALVAYDDQISLISESVHITSEKREVLKSKIRELHPGSMTYLSGGWLRGCQEVAETIQADQLNRAFLLTDGLANVGITDSEELGKHARELSDRGVSTSTFGVGEGFDHHLLEHMSNRGGGNFYFIAHPNEIPNIFLRELNEISTVTAKEVSVSLEIPPHISVEVLGDWRCERTDGTLRIFLGDLMGGRLQELYLKLLTPPAGDQPEIVLTAWVQAKTPDGQPIEIQERITFRYADTAVVQSAPRNQEVLSRFASVDVADAANQALILERQGKRHEANVLLKNRIRPNAPHLAKDQLNTYQDLSNRMERGMDESDRKSSHYQTYLDRRRREQ